MAVDGKGYSGYSNPGKCAAFTTVTTTSSVSTANNLSILNTSCNASASVGSLPTSDGMLNEHFVKVLRDTGCNGVVVRQALVPEEQLTGNKRLCILADGSQIEAPIARVSIDTPYFVGEVDAWCLKNPLFELIIGNVPKARDPSDPDRNWKPSQVNAVMMRQQAKREGKKDKSLHVPDIIGPELAFSPDDVIRAQDEDESLHKIRQLAEQPADESSKVRFFRKNGILYRSFQSPTVENNKKISQFIVPKPLRNKVMSLAHDSLMTGHLDSSRTTYKVMSEFYWPGVQADVRRFCRSCDICQRTTPKGRTTKVPLGEMPLIDVPFQRVTVDLIGPIQPATDWGNRYILTLVDFATRYPEAVALKGIETEKVAEALIDIFCRIGVPKEMLTDQFTQFTSELMTETSRLLSFRQLTTTPYHPMCNGLVERVNGTLKQIQRRLCAERPRDWDKFLSAALFAYRDATQESLGFSPFELVYGRTVRGPMRILRELWTKEVNDPEVCTTYHQYIVDLKERLESTCTMAKENLEKATQRYRANYNKRAKKRDMKVGEKVLVLLPTSSNKLLLQWRGPYEILKKVGNVDYRINMDGKTKTFHANMLKLYIDRNNENDAGVLGIAGVAVVDLADDEDDGEDELCDSPGQKRTEDAREVTVSDELSEEEKTEIQTLLDDFEDVLSDVPGVTTLGVHDIKLTTNEPVRTKPYPLPFVSRDTVCEEVRKMIEAGVIEPSSSPYCSPIVIVKKKDGTNRFCIDFRAINKITVFDAETIPNADDIFVQLSGCRYVSKFDLSKGYWQLPLGQSSKEITAFQTPMGLYQFSVMPFGLVNASASFSRLMRKLLEGMQYVDNFIDDVIVFTRTFREHVCVIKDFLQGLRASLLLNLANVS